MLRMKELQFRWRNGGLEAWLDVNCHGVLSWTLMMADGTPEDFKLRDNPFSSYDPDRFGERAVYVWCRRPESGQRLHRAYLGEEYADIKVEVIRRAKEFLGIESPTTAGE